MNSKVLYGIMHPVKGLLGFDRGQPTYPNEHKPHEVDLDNTSLLQSYESQLDQIKRSTLLQEEQCTVVPVTISCTIGEAVEIEW